MKIEKRQISELKQLEKNIRMHPPKQIHEYVRSLQKNGQLKLMVIDENNVIWIGNGLYMAMKECGYTEAMCIVKEGMTEAEKKKMMLSDNRIFDLGVDDMAVFDELIAELKDDLDVPGFDEDMLRSFVMDDSDVEELMSDYGVISDEKKDEIRETGQKYEERDQRDAGSMEQLSPIPNEPRVEAQNQETAEAKQEPQGKYIICPGCGRRIWL